MDIDEIFGVQVDEERHITRLLRERAGGQPADMPTEDCETVELGVAHEIARRIEELFALWKKAKKAAKDGKPLTADEKELQSKQHSDASDSALLLQCATVLGTQKEHVVKTVQRFLDEINTN